MAHIFASERAGAPQKTGRAASRVITGSRLEGLQHQADASVGPQYLAAIQGAADPVQRMEEEELLQGKAAGASLTAEPVQRMEDEEMLQGKAKGRALSVEPIQRVSDAASGQGLPNGLRAGVESLSGIDMGGVQVHYNSAKPSQFQAHAFAQGSSIHLAPGQERHLPHEAWHVAQQAQGRVKPTAQLAGQNLNDDTGLEKEADQMGARALQQGAAKALE